MLTKYYFLNLFLSHVCLCQNLKKKTTFYNVGLGPVSQRLALFSSFIMFRLTKLSLQILRYEEFFQERCWFSKLQKCYLQFIQEAHEPWQCKILHSEVFLSQCLLQYLVSTDVAFVNGNGTYSVNCNHNLITAHASLVNYHVVTISFCVGKAV